MPLNLGRRQDDELINNYKLEHLYNYDFGKGRYFQVVFESDSEVQFKIAPRTLMRVTYIKERDNIEGLEFIKIVEGKEPQKITFSKFDLNQLHAFLKFISRLDLKGVTERRIQLADETLTRIDTETRKKVSTILQHKDGAALLQKILNEGNLTDSDIINTGYRKKQLEVFGKLLNEKEYINDYKKEINKPLAKDETAWQWFFYKNKWIFGFSLEYRFQGILQKEFHSSSNEADGTEEVIGDFLLGDNKFTTFVELKLPSTRLFSNSQNRSNCWKLSESLIDSLSQILEQKASGQIKIETKKKYV